VLAPGGKAGAVAIALSGLSLTLMAMILATIPPPGTESVWEFRAKVIGGALSFILLGGLIYWRAKWSQRKRA
jgi:hypothetical protein